MARAAVQLIIRGRVQGVGYRWWAEREARRLGLAGWVRNRGDGSVELLAIGDEGAVEQLAALCRAGPAAAFVTDIDRAPAQDDGSVGFGGRPTL
jgi:acylphosphatase